MKYWEEMNDEEKEKLRDLIALRLINQKDSKKYMKGTDIYNIIAESIGVRKVHSFYKVALNIRSNIQSKKFMRVSVLSSTRELASYLIPLEIYREEFKIE